MGNDLSTICSRMRLNDIEKQNADYLFHNALRQINGGVDRPYKIVGYGKYNIVICIDDSYYRIGYRGRSDEAIEHMRQKYDIIKEGDYGFVLPLTAVITPDYTYYKIRMVNENLGTMTYDEIHKLFRKLLPLGDKGLAWIDYHKDNIRRLNGEPVIIDFDCWDQRDIQYYIKHVLEAYNVPHDPAIVQRKLLEDAEHRWRYMHTRDAATLFAVVHGYTDPGRYMRLIFNAYLYRKRCNLVDKLILNMDMYKFMMNRPFSLL